MAAKPPASPPTPEHVDSAEPAPKTFAKVAVESTYKLTDTLELKVFAGPDHLSHPSFALDSIEDYTHLEAWLESGGVSILPSALGFDQFDVYFRTSADEPPHAPYLAKAVVEELVKALTPAKPKSANPA